MPSSDLSEAPPAAPARTALDDEAAAQVLTAITTARWFGGKGRHATLTGLTPLPWLTPGSTWPAVRFEVAEISYPPDPEAHELYALAVAYWPEPQGAPPAPLFRFVDPDRGPLVGYDAMQVPAGCRVLLEALLDRRRVATGESEVSFHLSAPGALTTELEPRVFTGQQSNTSVMLGDVAMIKLFRRLELGHNLDIEVHDALSRSELADVAQLYGWVDASWTHRGQPVLADLAMVVEQLADAHDGWGLALSALRDGDSFAAAAAELGTALAETHAGLRQAFPTEQQAGADLAALMTARLAAAREQAPQLAPYGPALESLFHALDGRNVATQRVHGDFHLGQTLHTPSGWKIIDFEGEPVKSLAERKAPDSVWRDIAGMLRSFAYAAASVTGPKNAHWAEACREAFLTAYAGGQLDPGDAAVLRAYEADKASYEVVYEVRNRPDWAEIPMAAVAALANTAAVTLSANTAAVAALANPRIATGLPAPDGTGEGVATWHST